MVCDRDHTGDIPKTLFQALPESQRGAWRHTCAACAYLAGVQEGEQGRARLRQQIKDLEARFAQKEGKKK